MIDRRKFAIKIYLKAVEFVTSAKNHYWKREIEKNPYNLKTVKNSTLLIPGPKISH